MLQVCVHTGDIELTKLLTLKQYLHIYSEIKRHVSDVTAEARNTDDGTDSANVLDASVIMMKYATPCLNFHRFLKLKYLPCCRSMSVVQARRLSLFGHIASMPDETDARRIISLPLHRTGGDH